MRASIKSGLLAVITAASIAGSVQAYTTRSMLNNDDGTGHIVLACGDGTLIRFDYVTSAGGREYYGNASRGSAGTGIEIMMSGMCDDHGG